MNHNANLHVRRHGFSLIATLLIVAMIAIAIAGFLSVVTTETSTTRLSTQRAEARANAMVGLRKAIAQLQEHAGPDQRITASAAILDFDPDDESPESSGKFSVAHPYWTGVWSTTQGDTGKPWIKRDETTGGLVDHRSDDETFNDPAAREARALVWLVSGDGSELPTEDFEEDDDTVLTMAAFYRPDDPLRPGRIRARKVELTGERGTSIGNRSGERVIGHYAFWVADEGVKAKINVKNPYRDVPATPDRANEGGYRQLLVAPDADYSLLLRNAPMDEADKEKILATRRFMGFQKKIPEGTPRRPNQFHTITAYSMGVLSNTRDGGMRQDLSPYLRGAGADSGGISDKTKMIPDFPGLSPKFGRLRSWALSGEEPRVEDGAVEPRFGDNVVVKNAAITAAHMSMAESLLDLEAQQTATMKPLVVEAAISHAISRVPGANGTSRLRLHVYPRVVLWNPYAVALEEQSYAVVMTVSDWRVSVRRADGSSVELKLNPPNTESHDDAAHIGDTTGTYCFALKPVEIGVGECLVFSASHSGAQGYGRKQVGGNLLSATQAAGNQNYHLDDCFIGPGAVFQRMQHPIAITFKQGRSPLDEQIQLKVAKASRFSVAQAAGFPNIQTISCASEPGIRGYHPFPAVESLPVVVGDTPAPWPETREGYRLRWLSGNNAMPLSLLHFNLHSSISSRTPFDEPSNGHPEIYWNPYQRDVTNNLLEIVNYGARKLSGRKWGGNPFAAPRQWSQDRYVLFDVPRRGAGVLSLGQFQHAMLSEFAWHPSFAIGNSLLPPRIDDPRLTVPTAARTRDGGWNTSVCPVPRESMTWLQGLVQNKHSQHLVYDLSYEANHALWDQYFLSGADSQELRAFARDPANLHLPNARLRFNTFVPESETAPRLSKPDQVASSLLVDGAFNVNSTEPDAWAAVLATSRTVAFGGEEHTTRTPFPHFLNPSEPGMHAAVESIDSASAWAGYRTLSDSEIERLALAVVDEVKRRAPFVSIADFVNRRLADDATGNTGALQAAIDRSGINLVADSSALAESERERAAGGPWSVTQADLLTPLGPILSARSDTFLIKAYGDAVGINGKVVSRAGCEAVVQRTPEPVDPDVSGLNPGDKRRLGRKFRIVSFRWTGPAS